MKRRSFLAACLLVAGCGGTRKRELPSMGLQLDPYRPEMSDRINEVIYSRRSPEKMIVELAKLGVAVGGNFEDFKRASGIDDWFAEDADAEPVRYTSLTCGLSPVVDSRDSIVAIHRNRKNIDGKMHEEMVIQPES